MPDLQSHPDQQSLSSLVSGIVGDAQHLLKQQLDLFKTELRSDFRKTREATISLAAGAAVASVGGLLLCCALALFLNWYFNWQDNPAGGFALVGGALSLIGGALVYAGWAKFQSFNPLPDQTAAALQENLEWRTRPK